MFRKYFALLVVCAFLASTVPAQAWLDYPKPRRESKIEDFHGTKVDDPYRWMEETDSPDVKSWITAHW